MSYSEEGRMDENFRNFLNQLEIGKRCNVRTAGTLMRVVTSVCEIVQDGKKWVYWYWEPEHTNDLENAFNHDCGYSGVMIDEH